MVIADQTVSSVCFLIRNGDVTNVKVSYLSPEPVGAMWPSVESSQSANLIRG